MPNKPFITYEEQINHLVHHKKLEIHDKQYAIAYLKKTSYFALINGYKKLFKDNTTKLYKTGVCFEDIVCLYCFDEALRALLMKNILIIERKIKSLLSYYFSEKFGNEQEQYFNIANYRNPAKTPQQKENVEWLIKDIQKTIEGKNYDYIEYNRITYGNVPFWVMIQAISFGKISKMFGFMQQSIQQKICNEYPNIQINEMENMLKVLTKFRNVCAHNERLYEYKTKDSLKDMHIHKALQLPKRKGGAGYRNGSRDLYSVVIVFKCLLAEEEFAKFYEELQKMMSEFYFKTSTINKKLVFDAMGFPKNWAEIIRATNQKQEIHKKC